MMPTWPIMNYLRIFECEVYEKAVGMAIVRTQLLRRRDAKNCVFATSWHKKTTFENIGMSDAIEDDGPEFISLLSTEEEEEMDKEQIPAELSILPLKNT